jgi:hypothetical protein
MTRDPEFRRTAADDAQRVGKFADAEAARRRFPPTQADESRPATGGCFRLTITCSAYALTGMFTSILERRARKRRSRAGSTIHILPANYGT